MDSLINYPSHTYVYYRLQKLESQRGRKVAFEAGHYEVKLLLLYVSELDSIHLLQDIKFAWETYEERFISVFIVIVK